LIDMLLLPHPAHGDPSTNAPPPIRTRSRDRLMETAAATSARKWFGIANRDVD
jgi:hypothetical protein